MMNTKNCQNLSLVQKQQKSIENKCYMTKRYAYSNRSSGAKLFVMCVHTYTFMQYMLVIPNTIRQLFDGNNYKVIIDILYINNVNTTTII